MISNEKGEGSFMLTFNENLSFTYITYIIELFVDVCNLLNILRILSLYISCINVFFVPDWLFRGLGTKINKSINPTKRNPNLGWCIG